MWLQSLVDTSDGEQASVSVRVGLRSHSGSRQHSESGGQRQRQHRPWTAQRHRRHFYSLVVTDLFDGPGRAVGRVCVCVLVRVRTISDLFIWHAGSPASHWKVKVTGQSSRPRRKIRAQQLLGWPTVAEKQT